MNTKNNDTVLDRPHVMDTPVGSRITIGELGSFDAEGTLALPENFRAATGEQAMGAAFGLIEELTAQNIDPFGVQMLVAYFEPPLNDDSEPVAVWALPTDQISDDEQSVSDSIFGDGDPLGAILGDLDGEGEGDLDMADDTDDGEAVDTGDFGGDEPLDDGERVVKLTEQTELVRIK